MFQSEGKMNETILVTGVAGFIGSHTAKALLNRGDKVIGVDNLNDYYDTKLKEDRLKHFFSWDKTTNNTISPMMII